MEDDRQTDDQTDGEWVRELDVTNGQTGRGEGKARRPGTAQGKRASS